MKTLFFPLTLIMLSCATTNQSQSDIKKNSDTENFHKILDEEWNKSIEEYPEWATKLGDNRFNDRLNDESYDKIIQRQSETKTLLQKIKSIDRSMLSSEDQLNFDLFYNGIIENIEGFKYHSYLIPLDQMSGIQIDFANMPDYMPFKTVKDYENYISRLKAFPEKVEQVIFRMQKGLETGWVPPKTVLVSVPEQIRSQFETPLQESPLYEPIKGFPSSISNSDKEYLTKKIEDAIANKVYPAYKKLLSFFSDEYLPNCRETIACSDFPNGLDYYYYQAKSYTTTDLTPQEIHNIGLSEVERIHKEMVSVISQTDFKGDFDGFLNYLRTDPKFYHTSEKEILNEYRAICKKADAALPQFFGILPRLPYGVKAIPAYQAPASPTAYYYPGNEKAGRAGYFMANTYKLDTRPKYEMEALSIHEAVPGHHLQIAIAQEIEDIPMFRRHGGYTAFVEGWGLYSEKLAEEMGFYKDPYSKFGQLTYEMWRACRLVVDTGMHALGWSRDEAINFMSKNTAKTKNDIKVEIDRYIAWPGQALAYKIGELKIRELRAKAEKALGNKFNIRDFHDVVLGDGAVPLDILEKHVDKYISAGI